MRPSAGGVRCDPSRHGEVQARNGKGNGDRGAAGHGEEEVFLTNCSEEKLKGIIAAALAGENIGEDADAQQSDAGAETPRYPASDWLIDPYRPAPPDYAAVKKLLAAKRESLRKAAEILQTKFKWRTTRAEQFCIAADRHLQVEFSLDREMRDAVRVADGR